MAQPPAPIHPDTIIIRERISVLSRQYRYGVNPLLTTAMWEMIVKAEVFDLLLTRIDKVNRDMTEHGLPRREVDATRLVEEAYNALAMQTKLNHQLRNERGE